MTELQRIEMRLREQTGTFDLRPTLEKAAEIGDLLIEARSQVRHGDWDNWLARLRLPRRTAWDYIAVAKARDGNVWPATPMTIKAFLAWVRRAKYAGREAERAQAREEARQALGDLPDNIVLTHADCREYAWPTPLDLIVADPPWDDTAHYEWLASWAGGHLREGGLALVQASHHLLPGVMSILGASLTYIWTMSLVYSESRTTVANGRFRTAWRPVLVYGRGTCLSPKACPTPTSYTAWGLRRSTTPGSSRSPPGGTGCRGCRGRENWWQTRLPAAGPWRWSAGNSGSATLARRWTGRRIRSPRNGSERQGTKTPGQGDVADFFDTKRTFHDANEGLLHRYLHGHGPFLIGRRCSYFAM